jgi:hypothetical protein
LSATHLKVRVARKSVKVRFARDPSRNSNGVIAVGFRGGIIAANYAAGIRH